jgi:hypothetical protein
VRTFLSPGVNSRAELVRPERRSAPSARGLNILNVDFKNKHDINDFYWIDLFGYKQCLCKGGTNLRRAKSGRISFLDVLSAIPPFPSQPVDEYPSNNKLSKIAIFTMKCTVIFVFGNARPKNSLLISQISRFSKAYYSKGIHVNVFELCILTNFEMVFLVFWLIS